ncbi:permease [Flavisolibacter tropicus]|uniref:Probable membrane transporter protein n=2 Tax=Flavisolibacter tropicus TaxID=1492898 RepID=A0A172TU94_9BACT|nr:permease [Flavisolibacter tropicus]
MTFQIILLISLIGLIAGILSGLVGVGGGIIIVPALVFFLGFSQYQAQGTSLGLLLLPVGIFAVINYYNKGYIDIKVVAIMSIAFIIGGYFGSKLSLILSQDVLRKIFAIVLFYTAFKMLEWDKWIFNLFKK